MRDVEQQVEDEYPLECPISVCLVVTIESDLFDRQRQAKAYRTFKTLI